MKLLQRTSLLSAAVAVSFLVVGTLADDTSLPNLSTATETTADSQTASTASNTGTATDSAATTTGGSTTQATTAVITGGSTDSDTSTGSIPSITGDATSTDSGLPSGLPTLSGQYKIVAPSVPPTANAPYMQSSTLPEGTVFIAVGAILGFMAMSVLLWRGLVAWSLHRSVKRASLQQNMSDTKALFQAPVPGVYKNYHDRDSTISLSGIGGGGKRGKRDTKTPAAPHGASSTSLFFSPTAGAAHSTPGNRASTYLPAGYYAAGAAQTPSHISLGGGGGGPGISLSNLGPQSAGYGRARSIGPSPPNSPSLRGSRHMASSSTLNLNQGYGGEQRAPSAYLEDLFDGEGGPPVPGHQGERRRDSGNRF
ncbi:hypothetical protein LAWI1_G001577 [Lachnellula willkommii]|uniref:Vacuolar membrane protein n=1 Tax=Lachnellula willkommii TaxID=215461 RepID=A0A559MC00_9HELO|nr:hypothetical protein LAWI1_G001577 [Lachnellula willkommii]